MITAAKKVYRALRQYGFTATLKKITYRLKSKFAGKNKTANCPVTGLYGEFAEKYNSGEICGIAIVPSAFEFDELYNQRTINLAKYLSGKGYGVIYVAWQWHKAEAHEKSYQKVFRNVIQVPLYDFLDTFLQLKSFSEISNKKYIITLPAKAFYDLMFFIKENCFDVYYDVMDDWERFHEAGQAPWYAGCIEEGVILNANRVSAVSEPLVQKFSWLREDIMCVGNGYDPDRAPPSVVTLTERTDSNAPSTIDCNADEESAEGRTITVGYFGHLTDAWFDWQLILETAEKHGNVFFEIIGYGESAAIRKRVQASDNIQLIGKVEPEQLHKYAERWHAAMIPFKKSELAAAVDPIKVYEYLYFGVPAVVTGIPHLSGFPYVEVVDNDSGLFYSAVERAYERKQSGEIDHSVISSFLADKTWEKRFDRVFETDFLSKLYEE